jgi:hypothetical protein
VVELDGIAEYDCIGCPHDYFLASEMLEHGADVNPLLVVEVPGAAGGGFGMDEDATACQSHWSGTEVVGSKKVFSHGDIWFG